MISNARVGKPPVGSLTKTWRRIPTSYVITVNRYMYFQSPDSWMEILPKMSLLTDSPLLFERALTDSDGKTRLHTNIYPGSNTHH